MAKKKKSSNKKSIPRKSGRAVSKKKKVTRTERDVSEFWSRDVGLNPSQLKFLRYLTIGLCLIMALLSTRVGLNGDDDVQANYSNDLPSFYTSFGSDTTCFESGAEIKYYGALFELITGASNKVLGFEKDEPAYYSVRHVWNAIFGAIAMYFMAMLLGEIAGFRAALLGLGMIFFSMRFLGHSFFNPKDIPFAAGYMVSVYYIYLLVKYMPAPGRRIWTGVAAGIAMSVGVRVGGVLVIAYLGLFLGLYFLYKYGFGGIFKDMDRLKKYTLSLVVPSAVGLVASLLVWPYGLVNPFENIPESFEAFANFQTAIKVLFASEMVWSAHIPFRYILTWMLITFPVYSLVGLLGFLVFSKGIFTRFNPFAVIIASFAAIFPIVYVLLKGSALYDGWRHFLFVYPSIIIMVTLAWEYALQRFGTTDKMKYVVFGLLGLTALDSALFLVRNSSLPYVYFNPTVGGIKGATGDYELDYWGASVKQAIEWLDDEGIIGTDMTDTVTITSNFSHAAQVYTKKYGGKVQVNYVRWRQRNDRKWDYGIFINRFVDGSYIRNGYWPTSKTIHTLKANGAPIAIIEKADDPDFAYLGSEGIRQQNWQAALTNYQKEVEAHPDNELAWTGIGMAYLNLNQPQPAKAPLDKALEITPENQNALNFLGYYHFVTNQHNEARTVLTRAIDLHSTNVTAMLYLGRIEALAQNYPKALEYANDCINTNANFGQCYQLAADVYDAMGDPANAQAYRNALSQLGGGR